MQQLTGPVDRAFRSVITALEHAIAQQGADDADEDANVAVELPDEFSEQFRIAQRVQLQAGKEKRFRIVPSFQRTQHYLIASSDANRVVRLDKITDAALVFHDLGQGDQYTMPLKDLRDFIEEGIWELSPGEPSRSSD